MARKLFTLEEMIAKYDEPGIHFFNQDGQPIAESEAKRLNELGHYTWFFNIYTPKTLLHWVMVDEEYQWEGDPEKVTEALSRAYRAMRMFLESRIHPRVSFRRMGPIPLATPLARYAQGFFGEIAVEEIPIPIPFAKREWWGELKLQALIDEDVDQSDPEAVNEKANQIADALKGAAEPGQLFHAPEGDGEMEEGIESIIDYLRMADTIGEVNEQISELYDTMAYLGIWVT